MVLGTVAMALLLGACGSQSAGTQAPNLPPSKGELAAQRVLEKGFHEPAACHLQGPRTDDLHSERVFKCQVGRESGRLHLESGGGIFLPGQDCLDEIRGTHVKGGCATPSIGEEE